MRIALRIEYDGRGFCGWQRQPAGCGVQDALARALAGVAGHPVDPVAAGRTDAGVHAVCQVAHFDTDAVRPLRAWVRGTNALLPRGVAVVSAHLVPDEFHARFTASGRAYRYVLLDAPVRPALLQGLVGWHHRPLDPDRMRTAASALVGRHDFSAFRAAGCQARTPVRELRELAVARRGSCVVFDLRADAFLHHMVRNIVGTLVYVGDGRQPAEWPAEVLASAERACAAPTFSAAGLYLRDVEYDQRWGLPRGGRPVPIGDADSA